MTPPNNHACTETARLAALEREQAVMSYEVKNLRDVNHSDHTAIREDMAEMKADMKGLVRLLTDPDTGHGGRLRRLEDGQTVIVETTKTTRTAIATTAAAFLALLGVIAQAVASFLSATAAASGGPPTP